MAHQDVCSEILCQRIEIEKTRHAKMTDVYKAVAEEHDLPWRTVQTIARRFKMVDSDESSKDKSKKSLTPDEFWRSIARKLKNINTQIVRQSDLYGDVSREVYSHLIDEFNRLTDHILTFSDIVRPRLVDKKDEGDVLDGKIPKS